MKLYFCGSMTGSREKQENYERIINYLKNYGTILNEFVADKIVKDYEPEVVLQYVNTTTVSMTLQGNESQIREMLDDIARNYPGVQVRSFDINENTYVDSSLQQISQNNCECVLAVYTCGQLGTTTSGEEN